MSIEKESISCLIDDEVPATGTVLSSLKQNSESSQLWRRYHLIGEVLRDHQSARYVSDISSTVMQRLEQEPAILAPNALRQKMSDYVKPAVGFAMAATVAAVTVVSMQLYRQIDANQSYEAVAIAKPQPFAKAPVLLANEHLNQSGSTRWESSQNEAQDQLNDYLMVHAEYAATGNIQGMLPYVRLAGFEKNQ